MLDSRGDMDADSLVRIVLILVVVVLVLEVLDALLDITLGLFGPFRWIIQLALVVLLLMWLVDRL